MNKAMDDGVTPLFVAAQNGNLFIMMLILRKLFI